MYQTPMLLLAVPVLLVAGSPRVSNSAWVGNWQFGECWKNLAGAHDCIEFRLQIKLNGKNLLANVEGDGFQTYFRVQATVKQEGDSISIVFVNAAEDGLQKFKPGDVLFKLSTEKGKVYTEWLELQPTYTRLPAVQFERVKGTVK